MKLEVQEGDITDARRFRNPVSHRVLNTIYVDDTALVADSHASMQESVQRFAEMNECFGLLINQSKIVVMRAVLNTSVTPQHMLSQRLWRQRGIQRRTKVKVFNAVVISTLLYGAGTWTKKKSQTKRLESVRCHLARRMLGVKPTDHVHMTKAYESLGMTSLRVLLNMRTMVYMGYEIASHGARMPPEDGNVL